MEFQEHLSKMRTIQQNIINFLEDDENTEENQQNLINHLDNQKIRENKHEIRDVLHLISKISNNHHRNLTFYDRIKKILVLFQIEIEQNFTNYDLFNIFKGNKRILLLLFEEKFLTPDSLIASTITTPKFIKANYASYFYPEFKKFFTPFMIEKVGAEDEKFNETVDLIENINDVFLQKRRIGENDNEICRIIREDSIEEFITYINSNEISLSTRIERSIFETNKFLINQRPTLIEYAAFFGSIQVFRYLFANAKLSTEKLWTFAIHGQNPELIHFLEENKIIPGDETFNECMIESLKCHHCEMTHYLRTFGLYQKDSIFDVLFYSLCLKYYNYINLPDNLKNKTNAFFKFCKYDHYLFADLFLKTEKIDVNEKIIFN